MRRSAGGHGPRECCERSAVGPRVEKMARDGQGDAILAAWVGVSRKVGVNLLCCDRPGWK